MTSYINLMQSSRNKFYNFLKFGLSEHEKFTIILPIDFKLLIISW